MGFFSSRKVDDDALDEGAVSRVIRSRFYGRNKTKSREASTVSNSPAPSPLSGPSRLPPTSLPATHSPDTARTTGRANGTAPASHLRPQNILKPSSSQRPSADAATVNLAQRLSELATANAEGLVNDEEYRLLRQSLFERFASGSSVPTEAPLVRLSAVIEPGGRASSSSRPLSNFQVELGRAPSIQSKGSVTSTMTHLFRRATGRRSESGGSVHQDRATPRSDAASTFSYGSAHHGGLLGRKTSDTSIRIGAGSPGPADVARLSSSNRRRAGSANSSTSQSPATPASRRFATVGASSGPPSAFRGAVATPPVRQPLRLSDDEDSQVLVSARDIRNEIELVEAEARRLQDTFNGLELSTLTRRQRPGPAGSLLSPSPRAGASTAPGWGVGSNPRPPLRLDADAVSVRSDRSRGGAFSLLRGKAGASTPTRPSPSGLSPGDVSSGAVPLVAQPISLGRKSSMSSLTSRISASTPRKRQQPPTTPQAGSLGRHRAGSTSTVNVGSSVHLPLATVVESDSAAAQLAAVAAASAYSHTPPRTPASAAPSRDRGEDDDAYVALESEMSEIRRKRSEVTARYDARLEYLRARLKGAEMHEKLLRK